MRGQYYLHSTIINSLSVLLLLSAFQARAQVSKAVDLDKIPPVMVWTKGKVDNQWKIWASFRQELERVFKPLPDGLEVTNFISYGELPSMSGTTARYYDVTLKIKKFEYNPLSKKIKPEGETGCWIYCQVNTVNGVKVGLPGMAEGVRMKGTEAFVYVCNLRMETDATGNNVLFASSRGRDNQLIGHYYSHNRRLPLRQVTRKELFDMYQVFMLKTLNETIDRHRKSNSGTEDIAALQKQIDELNRWHAEQMRSKDLSAPAVVENIFFGIDLRKLDVKEGFHVWADDPGFFDAAKHPDQPQFVIVHLRRQDGDLPKKHFMDRFSSDFNLDVIANIAQDKPRKPGGINTINQSLQTAKKETASGLEDGRKAYGFSTDAAGGFPKDWLGMKNIAVQDYQGGRWLAISKPGYWYPKQFGKPLTDGFQLNYTLEWNKTISYYSGVFAVTLAELPYDQILQGFSTSSSDIVYNSFYDSYTPGFHRIVLRFDPHFNSGGQLDVLVTNPGGITLLKKSFLLPKFFKEYNSHRLQLGRKGNTLWVKDNDELIAELENAFQPNVPYNAFVFSRYTVNNDGENDIYFLKDISVRYK